MTFALTVPGTDEPLHEVDGKLVAGAIEFGTAAPGVWDLIRPERRMTLDRFAVDYAAVRRAEQRELTGDEVRALPVVRADHPLAAMWQQRAESHQRFKAAIANRPAGAILDIGAGCGWLSADLCRNRWHAAALDVTVDGGDGLAAARHHGLDMLLVRAEMEALPFATSSSDLAVFNASLHYAASPTSALAEASRVVRKGGVVVVLDSPVFTDTAAGQSMVAEFAADVSDRFCIETAAHEGRGYLTNTDLAVLDFERTGQMSRWRAQVHRWRGARRAGRETAERPLLLATIGASI